MLSYGDVIFYISLKKGSFKSRIQIASCKAEPQNICEDFVTVGLVPETYFMEF